jgi:protein O-mannosyl-transferase
MLTHSKKLSYLPVLLLATATFAVFSLALNHDFLINWDDSQYVVENPIAHGLTLENIKAAFSTEFVGNYAPIHIVSYMFDYELWGIHSFGFILINILLHAANGILFYLLLRRLSGEGPWILLASLVFLLHPVQVESVVWVSQRKNLLAMFFFLVGFHSYTLYKERQETPGLGFYWLSVAALALSLLSKSVAVVFPLVLVLFDVCYRREHRFRSVLIDKIPFILLAAAFAFMAIQSHSVQVQGGGTSYHGGNSYTTLLTMLPVFIRYLLLVVWPANLSAFYDPPIKTHFDTEVLLAACLLGLLACAGAILYRKRADLFFWLVLFGVALLPVSQIVPIVTLMNDRYLYFPMLGAAALLASAVLGDVTWDRLIHSIKYMPAFLVSLLIIGACIGATLHRIPVWQDSYTLWGDAAVKVPNVPLVHDCFGEGLLERGRVDEAIREFKKAQSLQPNGPIETLDTGVRNARANTCNNIGAAYGMKGMADEAIDQFTLAIQMNPMFDRAYFNLGNALMHKGLIIQALQSFERAVQLNPGNSSFQANLRMTREIASSRDSDNRSMGIKVTK